mmetsp:Transcript_86810/g.245807  ORF Transcript_86810/g.245807 Transcript_86810/m.245807 type:complete len:249 (-) Transcript_86810:18-764(-)
MNEVPVQVHVLPMRRHAENVYVGPGHRPLTLGLRSVLARRGVAIWELRHQMLFPLHWADRQHLARQLQGRAHGQAIHAKDRLANRVWLRVADEAKTARITVRLSHEHARYDFAVVIEVPRQLQLVPVRGNLPNVQVAPWQALPPLDLGPQGRGPPLLRRLLLRRVPTALRNDRQGMLSASCIRIIPRPVRTIPASGGPHAWRARPVHAWWWWWWCTSPVVPQRGTIGHCINSPGARGQRGWLPSRSTL